MLLYQITLSEATAGSIAKGILSREALGLPLDELTRAARRYVLLTAEQVRSAFAQWSRLGDLAQITAGPWPQ
ncbi:MAG: hypothetical protein JSW39_01940 [Desulfobacterales bacterium]|nr:MAG: hypothetical protein JSW39_01940 [Desulfobacterales bacterium]